MAELHSPARPIVIVGMGPAGMVAALALARRGVPVTVFEQGDDLSDESRASTFHPPSLEILDELGVADELIAGGLKAPVFQYRERSGEVLATLDLGMLADETTHPYRLQSEQNNLTRIILSRLVDMPHVDLRFKTAVTGVETAGDHALVHLAGASRDDAIQASWVIAADGAGSAVRRSLGIAYEGVTFPERFLVISTGHEWREDFADLALVSYVSDPEMWGVLLRTPRHWRALFPVTPELTDEEATDPSRVQQWLRLIKDRDEDYPVLHTSLYKVNQRVATTFGRGRVLLAGDSAHINNPLGGMGMNSGIHDARAAADVILAALDGVPAERAAEAYRTVRHAITHSYIQTDTIRNYQELKERDERARRDRARELQALSTDEELRRAYLRRTSMLDSARTSAAWLHQLLPGTSSGSGLRPAGSRLAEALARGPVLAPGCYDAVTARLLADAGAQAAFLSGAALSAALLGRPDLGYAGLTDTADQVARLTRVCDLPLIADADTGYGDVLQVAATVRALEQAGAAAITLEDQVSPKRCGHMDGKELLDPQDMCAKVRAARAARNHLLIIARTDALSVLGLDEAIERARAYRAAGADLILVEGVTDPARLRTVHQALPGVPLVINHSEAAGEAPEPLTAAQLAACGARLVIQPVTALLAASGAARDVYAKLPAGQAGEAGAGGPAMSWGELTDALDLPALQEQARSLTHDERNAR